MPRWVVTCPNCSHEFTHTEIDSTMLAQGQHDLFGVLPKPSNEKRTCPNCNTESAFCKTDLFYREDARGKGQSS
jgi:hypothetical protein